MVDLGDLLPKRLRLQERYGRSQWPHYIPGRGAERFFSRLNQRCETGEQRVVLKGLQTVATLTWVPREFVRLSQGVRPMKPSREFLTSFVRPEQMLLRYLPEVELKPVASQAYTENLAQMRHIIEASQLYRKGGMVVLKAVNTLMGLTAAAKQGKYQLESMVSCYDSLTAVLPAMRIPSFIAGEIQQAVTAQYFPTADV